MKSRQLLILAVLALVFGGAALWLSGSRQAAEQAELNQPAVAGLKARINDIDKVVVTGAGNRTIATLVRGESNWMLSERSYRADTTMLRTLLLGLAESRRIAAKTASPKLYDRLGVEDVDADDASGVKLELFGGGEPVALIVGENNPNGKGTYVRTVGEAQSWQLDRNIAVEKVTANWLQRDLFDILPGRVASVTIGAGKEHIEIVSSDADSGDFRIANLPKGREMASDFIADGTAGLLQGLRFDDVAVAGSIEPAAAQRKSMFKMKDGLGVEIVSWQQDGKTWASFQLSLDEAAAAAAVSASQAKEVSAWNARQAAVSTPAETEGDAVAAETPGATAADDATATASADGAEPAAETAPLAATDPAKDREQRLAALQGELAALKAKVEGHVFQLPTYKASNLNRELEAYLKPKG